MNMNEKEILKSLIKKSLENNAGLGILVSGPSGIGKTFTTLSALKELGLKEGKNFKYVIDYSDENKIKKYVKKFKILALDEAHLIPVPELFYLVLDRTNKILIFITNRQGKLPDAIKNRCINIRILDKNYSDLKKIFISEYRELPDLDSLEKVTTSTREVVQLAKTGKLLGLSSLKEILNILNYIEYNGWYLTFDEYLYIKLLEKLKRAAESTIKAALGIDSGHFKEIEQSLLNKGLIKIESRGRVLADSSSMKKVKIF